MRFDVLEKIIIFALGVFIGWSDVLINAAERGMATLCTPFWNYCNNLHWFWDLFFGSVIVLMILLIIITSRKDI